MKAAAFLRFFLTLIFIGIVAQSGFASECSDFFKRGLRGRSYPKDQTVNSSRLLLDSAAAITEKFPATRKPLNFLAIKSGKKVFIDEALPVFWKTKSGKKIPLEGILTMHAAVERSLIRHVGISEVSAREVGFQMQKIMVEAMGESWTEYKNFIAPQMKKYGTEMALSSERLKKAVDEVNAAV